MNLIKNYHLWSKKMKKLLYVLLLVGFSSTAVAQSDRCLAKIIATDLNMEEEQVFQVLKSFKQEIIKTLRDGKVVRLQGLGQFYVEHQEERPGNPRTGEMIPIPAKDYLRFKPSKVGNQSLN